jgi:hypothetical protein
LSGNIGNYKRHVVKKFEKYTLKWLQVAEWRHQDTAQFGGYGKEGWELKIIKLLEIIVHLVMLIIVINGADVLVTAIKSYGEVEL